jgi:hypothetical protein
MFVVPGLWFLVKNKKATGRTCGGLAAFANSLSLESAERGGHRETLGRYNGRWHRAVIHGDLILIRNNLNALERIRSKSQVSELCFKRLSSNHTTNKLNDVYTTRFSSRPLKIKSLG